MLKHSSVMVFLLALTACAVPPKTSSPLSTVSSSAPPVQSTDDKFVVSPPVADKTIVTEKPAQVDTSTPPQNLDVMVQKLLNGSNEENKKPVSLSPASIQLTKDPSATVLSIKTAPTTKVDSKPIEAPVQMAKPSTPTTKFFYGFATSTVSTDQKNAITETKSVAVEKAPVVSTDQKKVIADIMAVKNEPISKTPVHQVDKITPILPSVKKIDSVSGSDSIDLTLLSHLKTFHNVKANVSDMGGFVP